MIPSPAEVVRFRAVGAAGLRLGGAVCLAISLRSGLTWFAQAVLEKGLPNLFYRVGDAIEALYFLLIGTVLITGAVRWARWLMPMPESLACPACGYAIPARSAPVCPECGLALPAEFRGKPSLESPLSDSAWLARWRMAAVLPLRLCAAWLVISTIPRSFQLYVFETRSAPGGLVQFMTYAVGVAIWLLAPALASLCIHPRLWKRLGREA